METITFYSYKGGVGRTLALANVAIYLSRFRKKVCILDFDLEAPGLPYKFRDFDEESIKNGLVDYIFDFIQNNELPENLADKSIDIIKPSESQGGITLIPAGNVRSRTYWQKLASINWHKLFYEDNSEGLPFFLEFKELIRETFHPDFLLIDSRTGITEMSGLCTSILPEHVVFFIVNNKENIIGIKQIIQSLKKEGAINGDQLKTTFVLTRIPLVEKEEIQDNIVSDIKNMLNKKTENLEYQLNVEKIHILHSDRDLELEESIRMSKLYMTKNVLLNQDYLRLISSIIPEEVIIPQLNKILNEITKNIFEDPDGTQKELESLVASYPHPQSIERLIEFYFIRNITYEKILSSFHDLWNTFGYINKKLLNKYAILFKSTPMGPYTEDRFKLEIVEKYLKDINDDVEIKRKLAKFYNDYGEVDKSITLYIELIENTDEKDDLLDELLGILNKNVNSQILYDIYEKYNDDINSNESLKLKKINTLNEINDVIGLQNMILNDEQIKEKILENNIIQYYNIMDKLDLFNEAEEKIQQGFKNAILDEDLTKIYQFGRLYYRIGRMIEFEEAVNHLPQSQELIQDLNLRYRRHPSSQWRSRRATR